MSYYVFDSHCDTISRILDMGENLSSNSGHVSIQKMSLYKGFVQFFAIFVDPKIQKPLIRCLNIVDKMYSEVEKYSDKIEIVNNFSQMSKALLNNKIAAFITLEGGECIEDLSVLRILYRLGIRCIALTWNDDNHISSGINGNNGGLTPFGKEVVAHMNTLGMVIDVSHSSVKGFYDIAECSNAPFIASHSNSAVVSPHPRNLDDQQFKTIVEKKGMVGINFCPLFLNGKSTADVEDIIRHIEHFMALNGQDHVGLGADFDGIDDTPSDICEVSKLDILFNRLLTLNYPQSLVEKIFYKNYFNFVKNNL